MPHALIVEDNPSFRRDLSEAISRRFPETAIHQATNTISAWRQLQAQPCDVVFVDIELPGESGLALTRRLKYSYPSLVKVVMTVHDLPEFREAALALGADYFVPKESRDEMEAVLKILRRMLGSDDRSNRPLLPQPGP